MVVLAPVLAAALRWLAEAAGSAVPAAAQLPANCREAITHALLTCAIGPPRYFAPGWGPCSHCWPGLAVCWPAPRCVRGVLALGTCVDPTRAATGMVCRCLGAVALHGGGGRNRIAGVGRGSGADTDGTALRHFATSNYAACTTTACPPSQPLPFAANARSNRSGDEFSPPPTSTSIAPHDVTTWPRGALVTGRSVARQTRASGLNKETRIARLRKPVAWTPHPHRGCRIGEATHPGPPGRWTYGATARACVTCLGADAAAPAAFIAPRRGGAWYWFRDRCRNNTVGHTQCHHSLRFTPR